MNPADPRARVPSSAVPTATPAFIEALFQLTAAARRSLKVIPSMACAVL